jgi:hypothetical protein
MTATMAAFNDPSFDPLWFVSGIPVIVAFGYVLGILPALTTGFFAATFLRRGWGLGRRLLAGAGTGALVSLIVLGAVAFGPQGAVPVWVFLGNLAVTGAMAALVSTLVLQAFIRP